MLCLPSKQYNPEDAETDVFGAREAVPALLYRLGIGRNCHIAVDTVKINT